MRNCKEIVKDFIIPIISIFLTAYLAWSANSIANDVKKITQNSDVYRYYITFIKDSPKSIKVNTTSGILRKVVYIKFNDDMVLDMSVENGSFAEEQTDEKVGIEAKNLDKYLSSGDDEKDYMFIILEGGDGSRFLNLIVFDDNNSKVYDELEILNIDENSPDYLKDFKKLRLRLIEEKLIEVK